MCKDCTFTNNTINTSNTGNTVSYYLSDDTTEKCYPLDSNVFSTKMPNDHFNKEWVLYGRFSCPYCMGAVDLLNSKGFGDDTIFVDITNTTRFSKNEVLTKLNPIIGSHNTVPILFNKKKFVGGFTELQTYLNK